VDEAFSSGQVDFSKDKPELNIKAGDVTVVYRNGLEDGCIVKPNVPNAKTGNTEIKR
jgi:hypothetical protein